MNEKIIERAGEIIAERARGSQNFVTLAFVDWDGYPHTTTISISKSEGHKVADVLYGNRRKKRHNRPLQQSKRIH